MNLVELKPKVIEIKQIPYWEVESVWPSIAPFIQKALDTQDEWTLEGIKQALLSPNNQTQLWAIGNNGAIVTMIQTFQTGVRKCLLFLAGGEEMYKSLHAPDEIEAWAKKYFGVTKMIIHGRPGWEKVLSGYKRTTVCLEKKL